MCFILGEFQSEEDELDYLSSLLEIDDKTSKDNSAPSVGTYVFVYVRTCIDLEYSRLEKPLLVWNVRRRNL